MPLVVEPAGVDPVPPDPPVGTVADEPLLVALPSTLTASPDAVTGTAAPIGAWRPDRMPSEPEVVAPEPFPAGVDPAADDVLLVASPRTLTASPDAVTGSAAETGA